LLWELATFVRKFPSVTRVVRFLYIGSVALRYGAVLCRTVSYGARAVSRRFHAVCVAVSIALHCGVRCRARAGSGVKEPLLFSRKNVFQLVVWHSGRTSANFPCRTLDLRPLLWVNHPGQPIRPSRPFIFSSSSSELESDVSTVYTVWSHLVKASEVTAGLTESNGSSLPPCGCPSHLRTDCLYTGISSGPNTRYERTLPVFFKTERARRTSLSE